jgi:hypothetical protein
MFHLAARVVGFFVHWRVSEATFPASALFASALFGGLGATGIGAKLSGEFHANCFVRSPRDLAFSKRRFISDQKLKGVWKRGRGSKLQASAGG